MNLRISSWNPFFLSKVIRYFFFQVHIDINKISQEFVEIQTLFSLSRMNFLIFFFSFLFSRRKVVI